MFAMAWLSFLPVFLFGGGGGGGGVQERRHCHCRSLCGRRRCVGSLLRLLFLLTLLLCPLLRLGKYLHYSLNLIHNRFLQACGYEFGSLLIWKFVISPRPRPQQRRQVLNYGIYAIHTVHTNSCVLSRLPLLPLLRNFGFVSRCTLAWRTAEACRTLSTGCYKKENNKVHLFPWKYWNVRFSKLFKPVVQQSYDHNEA